jgi:hypothetical protein
MPARSPALDGGLFGGSDALEHGGAKSRASFCSQPSVAPRQHSLPRDVASFARGKQVGRRTHLKTTCQPDGIQKTMVSELAGSGICLNVLSDNSPIESFTFRQHCDFSPCARYWLLSWYWPSWVGWAVCCLRHPPRPTRRTGRPRVRRFGGGRNKAGSEPTNGRRIRRDRCAFSLPRRRFTR